MSAIESILIGLVRAKVFGKSLERRFLSASETVWRHLPSSLTSTYPVRRYGDFLHSLVRLRSYRSQYHATFFLRNRPELQLIAALLKKRDTGAAVKLTVLACSNGAEVFSILYTARLARPDLKIAVQAVDISPAIIEIARGGRYSLTHSELMDIPMFERLTADELRAMFDREGDQVVVKPWIREGITWRVADAADPELARLLGPQDIVVANRFLCHMNPPDAERCLRNMSTLVAPGGYLFVSGVDLDVRTKVARDLGWTPVPDSLEQIHDGDPSVRAGWPWNYWGLEPFTTRRPDWSVRYASVFQMEGARGCGGPLLVDRHMAPMPTVRLRGSLTGRP
jgi:SAM-dependent methyltransferase